jgi:Zn-dependent protease
VTPLPPPPPPRRRIHLDGQTLVVIGLVLLALYGLRHSLGLSFVLVLIVIIPSIILHEVAHGFVALLCGDDTAKRAGRLTLNPLRHIDPVGTLILPALLALSGLGAFGYAKPVPINPRRMRHPRNDAILVGLAGPATNLLLAGLSIVVLRATTPTYELRRLLYYPIGSLGVGTELLYLLGLLNVVLAVFNILPIPPLDGSILLERLLPDSALETWWKLRRYSMLVLLAIVLLVPGVLEHIFGPAENAWARVLAG